MDFVLALNVIAATVASVGGAGAIIIATTKFLINRIVSQLENRYQLKIDKELEQYKANLEQRTYVTKTQFDIELGVYRELSKGIFEFIVVLNTTVNEKDYPKREDTCSAKKIEAELDTYNKMAKRAAHIQELLYENVAFMPKHLFDEYYTLIELASEQFWIYNSRFHEYVAGKIEQGERVTEADKNNFEVIKQKFDAINENLRDYLQKLFIVE